MKIETVLTCPLGSKCEEAIDGKIYRCTWFTQLAGTNPNTGEQSDEKACAMAWLPVLLIENSKQQRSTAAAVESFRNEMAAGNAVIAGRLHYAEEVRAVRDLAER